MGWGNTLQAFPFVPKDIFIMEAGGRSMSSNDQKITAKSPKSVGMAVFLEFLIPGIGMMYARKIGGGIFILIISIFGVIFYYGMFQAICPGYYDPNAGTCTTSIFVGSQVQQLYSEYQVFAILLALCWLGLRIWIAVVSVRQHNKKL
jgi:TM2 domain-containing membrane protein YozV